MSDFDKVVAEYGPDGDAAAYLASAKHLADSKRLPEAAAFADRAFTIDPSNQDIVAVRSRILDELKMVEHGIAFRYIPSGTFLMGSENGDPDERPQHPVYIPAFWLAETPLSWETVCHIIGCGTPPNFNHEFMKNDAFCKSFAFSFFYKICLQYCEDETLFGKDWHRHVPPSDDQDKRRAEMFPPPPRRNAAAPYTYRTKPAVAADWQACSMLCDKLNSDTTMYALPTEAEWERAGRGGLYSKRYPWGDEPPDGRADFGRFQDFSLLPSKTFAPNAYGLYAVAGGVWEWTQDWYDAEYYAQSPSSSPTGPSAGKAKVLRGGSWSDCPEACTVSFRMAQEVQLENKSRGCAVSPNIGFRVCRRMKGS